MWGMRYALVVLAERLCTTVDRWEWSTRSIGRADEPRGRGGGASSEDEERRTRVRR